MKRKIIPFDAAAEGLAVTNKKSTTRRGKEGVSQTVRYYEQLILRLGKIKCTEKEWFIYQPKLGIWQLRKKESLYPAAIDVINREQQNSKLSAELLNFTWQRNQLQESEKLYGAIRIDPNNEKYYLINCPSNILQIDSESGEVVAKLKHLSSYMFTSSLTADYNSNASCWLFEKVLGEILSNDKADIELFLDFATLTLIPHSEHECCLMCIGEGGNGKSIIWHGITSLLGTDNVTGITLAQICHNDRKQLFRLERTLLNLSTETDYRKIMESKALKQIISGERITLERIYQEGFEMLTFCKLCFLLNNLPTFAGGSNAEARRFRFLFFPKIFEGESRNSTLRKQLELEKEGILKLLIDRLPRILNLKEIGFGGKASKQIHNNFTIRNNPIKAFVDLYLLTDQSFDVYVLKEDIRKAYRIFARDNDLETYLEDNELFKRIYQYKPRLINDRLGRSQIAIVRGCKLS